MQGCFCLHEREEGEQRCYQVVEADLSDQVVAGHCLGLTEEGHGGREEGEVCLLWQLVEAAC